MKMVGQELGRSILSEYRMNRYKQEALRIFALIGKGHNGGDALLAIAEMSVSGFLEKVDLAIACPIGELKPNTLQALNQLREKLPDDAITLFAPRSDERSDWLRDVHDLVSENEYDIGLDGLLGMQFKPPFRDYAMEAIEYFNEASNIRLRVAVDLPSGVGDESDPNAFQADLSIATGVFKKPLATQKENAGSIRYLDIGFFEENPSSQKRVLTDGILDPLRDRRSVFDDKRNYGHLAILAGSRGMPGALAMSVDAALLSGVGLVTVFAPESQVAALAASRPEAMWVSWPETPEGGLALEGISLLKGWDQKASALLMGPGMGNEPETLTLVQEIVKQWGTGLVLDADALNRAVFESRDAESSGSLIATPHLGEFRRLSGLSFDKIDEASLTDFAQSHKATIILKGPNSRISDGHHVFFNTTGNPILARGGSGDILAGLTAGLLSLMPDSPAEAACMATYWHGKAADLLAIARGQHSSKATLLLDEFPNALKKGEVWELA